MLGDSVVTQNLINNHIDYLKTTNQGEIKFEADQYVLATGRFINKWIIATPESI